MVLITMYLIRCTVCIRWSHAQLVFFFFFFTYFEYCIEFWVIVPGLWLRRRADRSENISKISHSIFLQLDKDIMINDHLYGMLKNCSASWKFYIPVSYAQSFLRQPISCFLSYLTPWLTLVLQPVLEMRWDEAPKDQS